MDTFKKILNLIPDHWEEVLAEASALEAYIDLAQEFVHAHEGTAKAFVDQLIPLFQLDWEAWHSRLQQTSFYQELAKVPVDLPAWTNVPEDFNWEEESQRKAFLDDKTALLKATIKDLSLKQRNGAPVDISLVVDQLREVVDAFVDIFENSNLTNPSAAEQFKEEAMDKVRPKVYALVATLTGLDLQEAATKQNNRSFDDRLQALADIPGKVMEAQPDPLETELPPEMAAAVRTMHQVQHALPAVQAQLHQAAPELQPVLDQLGELEALAQHLQTHFPLVAEAVQNLVSGKELADLDIEKLMAEVKALFSLIRAFLDSTPLTHQLLALFQQLSTALPIRLVGFEEQLTVEQQMAEWLKEAKAIFTFSNELDTQTANERRSWFMEKFEALGSWFNHVECFGTTLHVWLEGSSENTANNPPTGGNNTSADATTKQQSSRGMMQVITDLVRDSLAKGKLILQFMIDQDLGISIEENTGDMQPALKPTNYQVNSGAAAALPEERQAPNNDAGQGASADEIDNGPEGEASATPSAREVISMEQVVMNLLGDRKSGIISHLSEEKQDLAMMLKEEGLMQHLEADVLELWEESRLQPIWEAEYQALKEQLGLEGDRETPPSAADLLTSLLEGGSRLFTAALPFLQQVIHFLLDLLILLIDLLFEVIKDLRVPEDFRELLPQSIEEALFGDHDPNLVCLIVAMPMAMVKGLLAVPVQEMKAWMRAA